MGQWLSALLLPACFFSQYSNLPAGYFPGILFLSWNLVSLEPLQQSSLGWEAHGVSSAAESCRNGKVLGKPNVC